MISQEVNILQRKYSNREIIQNNDEKLKIFVLLLMVHFFFYGRLTLAIHNSDDRYLER